MDSKSSHKSQTSKRNTMTNQEHNNTTPTPKASLLLLEDNLCKRDLSVFSRNSSVGVSSRVFYYSHHRSLDEGVPFKWEMQPGTPINPPPKEIIPPITPPPAFLSHGLSKPFVGDSNKHSHFPANLKLWRWKNLRKRCFSKWSSHIMLSSSRDYNAQQGDSNSCGELEKLEGYSSSSSSSSSSTSSSKDRRMIKASPRQGFSGCQPWNLRNNHTGFR